MIILSLNAGKGSKRKGLWNCAKQKLDTETAASFKAACTAEWDADLDAAKAVASS